MLKIYVNRVKLNRLCYTGDQTRWCFLTLEEITLKKSRLKVVSIDDDMSFDTNANKIPINSKLA